MSEGARLRAEVVAAGAALAAAQAANDRLPYRDRQAAHNPGGAVDAAGKHRSAAGVACWRFHEGPDATVDDVAAFIAMTGKPPRIRDDQPADVRNQLQVRNMVATKLHEAIAAYQAGLRGVVAEILTAHGIDPGDAGTKAVTAGAIRRWAAAQPVEVSP